MTTTTSIRIEDLSASQIRRSNTQELKIVNTVCEATKDLFMATMAFYATNRQVPMSPALVTALREMYASMNHPNLLHWSILDDSCDLIGRSSAGQDINVINALSRGRMALIGGNWERTERTNEGNEKGE